MDRVNRSNSTLTLENLRLKNQIRENLGKNYTEENRDDTNWSTIISMYQDKLKALKDERDTLKLQVQKFTEIPKIPTAPSTPLTETSSPLLTPEPQENQLSLPFHLPYQELEEANNVGFSKRLVKTVKAAILVALKKEPTFEHASNSIISYLRSVRSSQNWLCSFNSAAQSEMHMKCHL